MAAIAAVFLVGLVLVEVQETIARFVFNSPTDWSLDVARYLFAGIVFLSLSYTMQENGHIAVDFVIERLNKRSRKLIGAVSSVFGLFFIALVILKTIDLLQISHEHHWMTYAHLSIPTSILYALMALGFSMLLLTYLTKVIKSLQ